ncbi:hypothetical protein SynROS8604_03021 [Synechococcus sp. ROS8604]|nr:hypothetical protein SynROS8604_03021 [Synechococcus sp. ROS8604]
MNEQALPSAEAIQQVSSLDVFIVGECFFLFPFASLAFLSTRRQLHTATDCFEDR